MIWLAVFLALLPNGDVRVVGKAGPFDSQATCEYFLTKASYPEPFSRLLEKGLGVERCVGYTLPKLGEPT